MLNPSKAGPKINDDTVLACMAWANRWKFESLEIVNMFPRMGPNPNVLANTDAGNTPVNEDAIREAAHRASAILVAWGRKPRSLSKATFDHRQAKLIQLLETVGPLNCVRQNADGTPRHPGWYARRNAVHEPRLQPFDKRLLRI